MAIVAAGIITALVITILSITIPAMMGQILGHLLYGIGKLLLDLADFMQMIFRRLAGLDVYWYKDGESYYHNLRDSVIDGAGNNVHLTEHDVINNTQQDGDILLKLFSSNAVVEALIAMTLFAVALLLIVTIVQIIRVEYTTEGSKNSKGTIIGKALKSLAMFILVPVLCFIGVFVSNKLLLAVDAATAQSGSSTLSGYIFLAAAADANVIRCGEADNMPYIVVATINDERVKATLADDGQSLKGWKSTIFGSTKASSEAKRADIANDIDQVFVAKYNWSWGGGDDPTNTAMPVSKASDGSVNFMNWKDNNENLVLHYSFTRGVEYFYNLLDINYLILFFGGFMTLMSLFRASFGLVLRLYKATALFIISPGVTALTPIDDGNAYKQWRKAFISNVLGAYGFVVAMNLLFLLMGIIDNIHLFDPNNWASAAPNALVRAVMVIVGVNMMEDLAKQISGFVGGADILSEGKGAAEKAGKSIGKIGSAVGAGVMIAGGLAGGIASRIYSSASRKELDKGKKKARMEELQKKKDSGEQLDNKEERELRKLNRANEKGDLDVDFEKAEKYRARAAQGKRASLRGAEVLKNQWEGSAVGSFLNTATGGYIPSFGGKQIKNLDEKLYEGNEAIYDMAKKSDGGAVPGWFKDRIKDNKWYSKVLKAPGAVLNAIPNFVSGGDAFMGSQADFETSKANESVVKSYAGQVYNGMTHEVEKKDESGNTVKERVLTDENQSVLDEYRAKTGTYDTANNTIGAIKSMMGNWNSMTETEISNFANGLKTEGLTEDAASMVDKLKRDIRAAAGSKETMGLKIDGIDVSKLQAENIDGYLNSENGKKGAMLNAIENYDKDFEKYGFAATENLAKAINAYEDKVKNSEKTDKGEGDKGKSTGTGGDDTSKDLNIKAENVKLDTGNTEMKSDNTKIDDKNQVANKMASSLKEAIEQANKKKEQAKKDNEISDMLKKIQKILKNVEKNTKKK